MQLMFWQFNDTIANRNSDTDARIGYLKVVKRWPFASLYYVSAIALARVVKQVQQSHSSHQLIVILRSKDHYECSGGEVKWSISNGVAMLPLR